MAPLHPLQVILTLKWKCLLSANLDELCLGSHNHQHTDLLRNSAV
jgi:hypothetical protein